MRDYGRWRRLLREVELPAAVVDLDALDHNIDAIINAMRASDVTLRVATKSLRHVGLIRYVVERGAGRFKGLMTYSARETRFLGERGFDDFLIAYPFARPDEAAAVAEMVAGAKTVRVMVDSVDQLPLLEAAAAEHQVVMKVCIDIDCSLRLWGGQAHLGVRRSPIRSVEAALLLARAIADTPGLQLDALMAYEAQVAGIQDSSRTQAYLDPLKRLIKRKSLPLIRQRRQAISEALANDGFELTLFNGGGTGSLAWTSRDPSVTEVTAGSGFLCPHIFDGYRDLPLKPAAFFALAMVRRSDADHVTCAGGGYIASGPPGKDRLPLVHLPTGLTPLFDLEGFGEVQTPFKVASGAPHLALGDPVICRHAKAGELAERFERYHWIRGDEIVTTEPTYRGMGASFL